jgi:hypothetical protein
MKRAAFTVAGLILAATALSEDLPAGAQLLSRVKIHIKQELQRLAMISCLETVQREVKQPKGKMRPLDTIRLEVLTNGDKELFASPGDRKFSEKHPLSYAGGGTLGNGLFGLYLTDIVAGESVSEHYIGEEEIGGRRLVRYDYQVPPFLSGQNISTPEGSGRVGLPGSFWVDPQTYDVVRLEFKGDEFPPTLPLTEMTTRIDYARSLLRNDMSVLLPDAADFHLVKNSGEISHNLVEFHALPCLRGREHDRLHCAGFHGTDSSLWNCHYRRNVAAAACRVADCGEAAQQDLGQHRGRYTD